MKNKISKIENKNTSVLASQKKLLSFLDKRTIGKYIESGELEILEKDISFKSFKKLFKNTEAIVDGYAFMNPKANNFQVAQWISASNTKNVINTYFAHNTDRNNAKTMSICVFENLDDGQFPFVFFSQEEDEWAIENEIDGDTNDALNDLYATRGGKDFYIVMIFKMNIFALPENNKSVKLKKLK